MKNPKTNSDTNEAEQKAAELDRDCLSQDFTRDRRRAQAERMT
jgi:hypothetical protein